MRGVRQLPTLAQLSARPRAQPKPGPRVLREEARREAKDAKMDAWRDAVWDRDGSRSRASGVPVLRSHLNPHKRGEAHHLKKRSTSPRLKHEVSNGVLLTAFEHELAEAWPPRLDIRGRSAAGVLTFVWRDDRGRAVKRTASAPPSTR